MLPFSFNYAIYLPKKNPEARYNFRASRMALHLKATCHTDALLWTAREITSMAPPAERERHAKNVWHIALNVGYFKFKFQPQSSTFSTRKQKENKRNYVSNIINEN